MTHRTPKFKPGDELFCENITTFNVIVMEVIADSYRVQFTDNGRSAIIGSHLVDKSHRKLTKLEKALK